MENHGATENDTAHERQRERDVMLVACGASARPAPVAYSRVRANATDEHALAAHRADAPWSNYLGECDGICDYLLGFCVYDARVLCLKVPEVVLSTVRS
jgi:hypothetical protein